MRKARLLSTVAATLLLAAGVASAQTMNKDEAPGRAPAAQQNAPAEKVAPAMKPGEQKASTKKGPETIGQVPNAPESDKSQMKKSQTMDKGSPAGPAVKGSSDANGGANVKSKSTNSTAESAPGTVTPAAKSTAEEEARTTRSGRSRRLGQAVDRAAQQDQQHHQAAKRGTGASQRFGARGNSRAG